MKKDGLTKLNHTRQENKARERSNLPKDLMQMQNKGLGAILNGQSLLGAKTDKNLRAMITNVLSESMS